MIRCIAAVDSKLGIANEVGIPWKGKLPTDTSYYRNKVRHHNYIIGYGTYVQHTQPLPDTPTFVATKKDEELRPGFNKVTSVQAFLQESSGDVWVGGGAVLFASTIAQAEELYLTRIDADFNCTKFFPEFENDFELASETEPQTENNLTFRFQVWKRKS